jgi:hypothetical protein
MSSVSAAVQAAVVVAAMAVAVEAVEAASHNKLFISTQTQPSRLVLVVRHHHQEVLHLLASVRQA